MTFHKKKREFLRDIFEDRVLNFIEADRNDRHRPKKYLKSYIAEYADVFEKPRPDGRYLFHRQAEEVENAEILKFILELTNIGINSKDELKGRTALHYAASVPGNVEVVRFLISKRILVQTKDSEGQTALHIAASAGHVELVEELLKADVDVNATRNDGCTALMLATERVSAKHSTSDDDDEGARKIIEQNATDIVRMLVKHNADVNVALEDGWTALHSAALYNAQDIVRILVGSTVVIRQLADNRRTPLHIASEANCQEALQELIKYKQGLNVGDEHQWTVLHMEAMSGNETTVKQLLRCGADQHKTDTDGWTPLESAVFYGDKETIMVLLRGATKEELNRADNMAGKCEKTEARKLITEEKKNRARRS